MSAGVDLLREQRPSMEAVISSFLCSFILIKPQKIKAQQDDTQYMMGQGVVFNLCRLRLCRRNVRFYSHCKMCPCPGCCPLGLEASSRNKYKVLFFNHPPCQKKNYPLAFFVWDKLNLKLLFSTRV